MINFLEKEKEEKIRKIAQKYFIELFLLFGSRIGGQIHKESDYDIAYLAEKKMDLEEESRLIIDLAPIFESESIDLVNLKTAPPLLFYRITQECQILYENKPMLFISLRAYAFKRYIEEVKPLIEDKFQRLQLTINKL